MPRRHSLLWLLALLLLVAVPQAGAHKPLWGDGNQIEIPNLTTSFAAYRTLSDPEQIDTFIINAREGDLLDAGITIPQIAGLEEFKVRAALFGPGLPEADHSQLPADHPEELGARVFPSQETETFFEPFTQTNYWGRQEFAVTFPQDGTYYLLIWNTDGDAGKYVLATGNEERFAPTDLLRFPIWWVRVHAFFNHTAFLVLGAALLLGLVTVWLRRRRNRSPGRSESLTT